MLYGLVSSSYDKQLREILFSVAKCFGLADLDVFDLVI